MRNEQLELDRLYPVVYAQLRRVARRQLQSERPGHTLDTTALVHETYLRLSKETSDWSDRPHFFALAARAMRRILIEHARKHRSGKRGGGVPHLPLEEVDLAVEERAAILVALDEALTRLAAHDQRQCQVVECRFFGGYTEDETAAALGISVRTVKRDWEKAKSWLYQEIYSEHLT